MNKSIVLDKHEMVIDKEEFEYLHKRHNKLNEFAKWCLSDSYDSRDLGYRARHAMEK